MAQALGQEGAPVELARVAVLVAALAPVDLAQVGGEFGLLVAAGGDVGMRGDDLAPGLEAADRLTLDGGHGAAAGLVARLFGEAHAQDLLLHAVELLGLGRGDGGQQAPGTVERAIGIVGGEGLLVGPLVAHIAQLEGEVLLGVAQGVAEDAAPLVDQDGDAGGDVPAVGVAVAGGAGVGAEAGAGGRFRLRAVDALHLAPDERPQPHGQEVEGLADPLSVGCCHADSLLLTAPDRRWRRRQLL